MSRISRRRLVSSGLAAGMLAATGLPARAAARHGGRLRIGAGGASPADSWDARGHAGLFMTVAAAGAVFDTLTEVTAEGLLKGELATGWEASADARVWTVTLREGVTFHDGTPFAAEDVIGSLALHLDPDMRSPARPLVEGIAEMKPIGAHRLRIALKRPNPDLPYLLADPHLLIYPAGRIAEAMEEGIGTGLYRVARFEPGRRFLGTRVAGHYKDGEAGWFDEVEILALNEAGARMRALARDRVDVIGDVDPARLPELAANRRVEPFEAWGNRVLGFAMRTDVAPFDNPHVRRALKHAVDRESLLAEVLRGRGSLANDHLIGPANPCLAEGLAQTVHDPEAARADLRRAGLDRLEAELVTSEAAFPGAVEAAHLYRAQAAEAGIAIRVTEAPAEGYWQEVWPTAPWRATAWAGRPTEDWILSAATAPGAPWNETGWINAGYERLLEAARAELDSTRRGEIYAEMQRVLRDEGGLLLPVHAPFTGAASKRLAHPGRIGNLMALDSARIAERWWMA